MRRIPFFLLLAAVLFGLTQPALAAQRSLKIGDNLFAYVKENPPPFTVPGIKINPWLESQIDFMKYKAETTDKDQKILLANKSFYFGVLQDDYGVGCFIYDLNGDGFLDAKTYRSLLLPYWIVGICSPNKTKNDNVKPFYDMFYNAFQADENPYTNNILGDTFQKIDAAFAGDQNLENRDLIYDLQFYSKYCQEYLRPSLELMEYVAGEFETRFGYVHPLIYLHTAETLINLGQYEEAKTHIDLLLEKDPDFIPAEVYACRLEDDPAKAAEMLKKLKADHPNHWIVKQL